MRSQHFSHIYILALLREGDMLSRAANIRGIPISLEHNDIPIFWDSRRGVDFSLVPIRKKWVLSPAIAMTREFLNPIFLGRVQKFWFRPDSENLWSLEFDKLVLKFDEFVLKFDIIV